MVVFQLMERECNFTRRHSSQKNCILLVNNVIYPQTFLGFITQIFNHLSTRFMMQSTLAGQPAHFNHKERSPVEQLKDLIFSHL